MKISIDFLLTNQKQPIPVLDNLIVPPFESDVKKSMALTTPKASAKVKRAGNKFLKVRRETKFFL